MKTTIETQTTNQSTYDVIISGGGPVGLFLACELATRNCTVLLLERATEPRSPLKQLPFGIRGLNSLSIESLDRRGMLDELEINKRIKNPHRNSGQGQKRQAGHFAGIPFLDGDIDTSQWPYRLPSSTVPSLISEIQELETIFTRRADSLGVIIKRGEGVTTFEQNESIVTVNAGNPIYQSKWLVGCDGSRSAVRKAAGIEFAGTEPEFTGYTLKADVADPEKLGTGRNVTSKGMYLQSQPGYIVIQDFDGGAFHDSGEPLTLDYVQQVLRKVSETDVTLNALHTATTWTDRARQATAYRKGRVLLAGDAAHIHAPLGGQGLNLGLGDAMNLGWKLAVVIKQGTHADLLDSYYTERHPIGAQVLDWSRAQVAIMQPTAAGRALNAIFRDLIGTRDGATYFAGKVWGIDTRYDLGGDHPLVGRSVPNFEFQDGTKVGELLRDGRGLLLDFDGNSFLNTLAKRYHEQIKYVRGSVKEQLGFTTVLVRPDGFVCWVADDEPDSKALEATMVQWFDK